jgi:hypothetical protein
MSDESGLDAAQVLLAKIRQKRGEIAAFIGATEPRNARLTNIAIICGAISAALTAAPALGGKPLTDWITEALGLSLPIWQLLCFGGMVCSIAATIATNLSKSHETSAKLIRAQLCDAKLEGLETLTQLRQVDVDEGAKLYVQHLADIPFI